ncbi:hypothetical protein ACQE98_16995 [Ornithinimicrobium sp. W1679]|uniref:hypothetical protein n=1 Tax=unclassified Ornithinimicrobium TaxID=2615080 RepID=UPI003CEC0C20
MSTIRTRVTTTLAATGLTAVLAACGSVTASDPPAVEPAAPAPVQQGVQYSDSDILLKQKVAELRRNRPDPGCEPALLDQVISDHVREQLQQQCQEDAAFHDRWNDPRKGGGVPTFE